MEVERTLRARRHRGALHLSGDVGDFRHVQATQDQPKSTRGGLGVIAIGHVRDK